jgi:hypothetical protein
VIGNADEYYLHQLFQRLFPGQRRRRHVARPRSGDVCLSCKVGDNVLVWICELCLLAMISRIWHQITRDIIVCQFDLDHPVIILNGFVPEYILFIYNSWFRMETAPPSRGYELSRGDLSETNPFGLSDLMIKPKRSRIAQTVVAKRTTIAVLPESPRNSRTNNRNVTSMSSGVNLTIKIP